MNNSTDLQHFRYITFNGFKKNQKNRAVIDELKLEDKVRATLLKIDRFYNLKEIAKVEFEEFHVSLLDFHESGGFGLSVSHFFQSYI